jgi:hypothetical protein
MSNLFKKVTSSVALLAVVFSVVSPIAGANAAYTSSIEAANKLAASGVITDKSANPADYRLGDNITRREMVKVAMQLASCQDVTLNTEYKGKFSDVASSDWAWKYAETAVDNGFIAANATFSPARNVSKAEALKMVMNATQVSKSDAGISFWADYVAGGVAAGIVEDFTDFDTQAQRGWIFKAAASALEAGTCGAEDDSTLDDLLDGLDDTDGTDTGSTDDTTDDTTTTGGTFTVALSPDTAPSASVPAGATGLPVASYDFTAGDSDVTVTSITVKRRGLSDSVTLNSLAAFSSDGRASKGKDDSQNDNTEALLTLTNGFVVKAGETRTLTIVADIEDSESDSGRDADTDSATNDEFAIELVEVVASATAQSEGSLVGNTMKVGSVDAAQVTIQSNGTVSNPKLGEQGVDIFKFAVKGASDEDVILKSITFRADNSNAEENLENFKVYLGSTEVASAKMMNDKYVTFTFGNGYTIAKNKVEKFTVKADVVAGANDVIKFYVDKSLDVSANGTKYGYGAAVDISTYSGIGTGVDTAGDLGSITIQAGELTLVDIDAPADKIREDKDDVVLGSIKVTNVAGKSLELQDFGVRVAVTWTPYLDANNDNVKQGTEAFITNVDQIFENVELYNVDSGASYEIDTDNTVTLDEVFSDTDMGISLSEGTTNFQIRADVKENLGGFDTVKINLNLTTGAINATTGGFKVVETEDDTVVTDITPSTLSWKTVSGLESGATVSVVSLSDMTKVRGSNDVVAMQFEIEADESSAITINEISALVRKLNNTADATNGEISQVALYKGSVWDANLIDRVSGSNLANGVAAFDGFDVAIAANQKQTFVITLSFVDGASTVAGSTYSVRIVNAASIGAEDDDNDDIDVGGTYPLVSARDISITNAGSVAILEAKTSRVDNEFNKTILAGTSKKVVSYDVKADNEGVDVETVTVTYAGPVNLNTAGATASLYLGDTLIATATNADITGSSIVFDDLTSLIIPTTTSELKVAINTMATGKEQVGVAGNGMTITDIALSDMEGADSGIIIAGTVASTVDSTKTFDIVPVTLVASVNTTFGTDDGTSEFTLTTDDGTNTTTAGTTLDVEFDTLTLEVSAFQTAGTVQVFNGNGDAVSSAVNVTTNGNLVITLNNGELVSDNTEKYRIETTSEASFRIAKNGVGYIVNATTYTMNLNNSLALGAYADSN